jgi:uncharacterized membrane protein YeaQ/YmgE (transglycosylase-associated protein family)
MINICLCLLAGALVGGAASRLPSALAPDDLVVNIVVGMLGALLGGVVFTIFNSRSLHDMSLWAFVIALFSAGIAILLARLTFRRII